VFIYGGSILPGKAPQVDEIPEDFRTRDLTVQDMFEAVGRHQNNELSDKALDMLERVACPSAGACGGQFTANTMACVSEAIGLALMNSSGMPAPYESRDSYAEASGRAVMALLENNIRARDVVTRKSLRTPRGWWPAPAGRPMPGCTCRPSRTRRGSSSSSTMSARSSATRPISSISSRAGSSSPRTSTMRAASRW
jgi:hypothetical protein